MSSVDELLQLPVTPSEKMEWKESEYAIYQYLPNKEAREKKETDTRIAGAGFSLTLIGSSISPDREHLLREHIGTRMSHGTLYHSSGQVTTLDPDLFPPPSQSYFCLVDAGSGEGGVGKREFLICFVSIGKQGLDLFRTELDTYCEELIPLLKDLPIDNVFSVFPGSRLEQRVNTWFSDNVSYLVRVVRLCHSQLPVLLHTAVNSQVTVTGDDPGAVRDVKQFLDACSLANLLQLNSTESKDSPTVPFEITVTKDSCQVSSEESSKFCANWSQVLLAQGTSSPDPFFLRQAVENYKLKIIQDINALKRLLRQAETDYHALYRCYVFLCVCGNGRLLLQCAIQEAQSLPSPETLEVLKTLHTYSDKNGFTCTNVKT